MILAALRRRAVGATLGASKIGNYSRRAFSEMTALGASGSLLLRCQDSVGIVAEVASSMVTQSANIRNIDVHIEKGVFVCRCCFEHHSWGTFDRGVLESGIDALTQRFDASASLIMGNGRRVDFGAHTGMGTIDPSWEGIRIGPGVPGDAPKHPAMRVVRDEGKARVGVFMSKTEHCLLDLLNRSRGGDLPIKVAYVVSNHKASEHLEALLAQAEIPYHYVPHTGRPREEWDADLRDIVSGETTDFLVLARYMQVPPIPHSATGFGSETHFTREYVVHS